MRYLEDLQEGQTYALGTVTVTEDEIVRFARRYDPQPFHLDRDAAAASIFGGLVASGWHTCALFMRLLVTGFLTDTASLGSPGVDELRWPHPVRPGDTLSGSVTVVATRVSASRPDRGVIRSRGVLANAAGAEVLTLLATNLIARRPD